MKLFCYDLNLKIPLFKSEINPLNFPKVRHTKLSIEFLNPLIVEWFRLLSLEIVLVEVFYSRPKLISGIHTDSTGSDINKINWVYGGSNCEMKWYSLKDSEVKKPASITPINTRYQLYSFNEVNLECSRVLHSPSLVNVGVPHNVCNHDEDRWCVSVVYQFTKSKQRPTMQQALDIFKDYINEI